MSHFVRCNRCSAELETTDEKFGQEWADLKDSNNNVVWDEGTVHLCTECVKDFQVFMRTPRPVSA